MTDKPDAHGVIADPKLYARLSAPFATLDEADAAMHAFHAAVRKLRAKHRIADVVIVSCVSHTAGNDTQPVITMLAWALGKSQKRTEDNLARMIASGRAAT
jgi:hypothetical protein